MRDMVEAASLDPETFKQPRRGELDSISFDQWIRESGGGAKALLTARLWVRGTLGQDSCEVSALAYLEICRGGLGLVNLRSDDKNGAQRLRLQEGTQSIAIGMSKLIPSGTIKLNTPVTAVTRLSAKLYSVATVSGQVLKAQKVIVTVPGPAYKDITFSPTLPFSKQVYTNAVRYGVFIKYICLFKTPFWRRQGACGLGQSFRGPINHLRDTSVDSQDNYALTCFMTAGPGRKWWALNEEERRDAALQQLGNLFGVEFEIVKSEFVGSITSQWTQDRWAGWGCPFSSTPPGAIGDSVDGERVREKFGGLYFVGTELTDEWRGYMEGALRSGKRGAAQALADLDPTSPRL
jgi:monoamine oxidase